MASKKQGGRLRTLGVVALIAILVLGFVVWWFMFRDTSAASVDSVAAAEAREQAIADAAEQSSGDDSVTAGDTPDESEDTADAYGADAEDPGSSTEVDSGQPDSAASVGSPTDGLWTVDTSIGIFNDACLDVACSSSFVGFRIDEELARFGAKTVVGRTPGVTGSLEIAGTQIASATIVADMTQLVTDDPSRTRALESKAGGLETRLFPEASFVLVEPIELGQIPVEGASVQIDAVGELTVHGTTNRVTVPLTAELQAGLVVVFGNLTDLRLEDYAIPKPSSLVVVSVEEVAAMEFQLFYSR